MKLHVVNSHLCIFDSIGDRLGLQQRHSCRSLQRRSRRHCRQRCRGVLSKKGSAFEDFDPQHSHSSRFDQNSSSDSSRSCEDQHIHIGAAPDQPQAPQPPNPNRFIAVGLGLAAFSGLLLAAFAFWQQQRQKQRRRNHPSPAPEWQSKHRPAPRGPRPRERSKVRDRTSASERAKLRKDVICRNFAATGSCRWGNKCRYKHELVPQEERGNRRMRSSSPLSSEEASDSSNESDDDEGSSVESLLRPKRHSAIRSASSDFKDSQARARAPATWQTLHKTYTVPAEQAYNVGKLMGYRGARIRQIASDTGCCINVARNRPENEPVPIEVWSDNMLDLLEAVRLIAECFQEE